MLYVLRLIILLLLIKEPVAASDLEKNVQRTLDQAKKTAATIKLPVNKHHEEGIKAARQSATIFNSPEFQEKIQCEQQRIKEEVFTEEITIPANKEMPVQGKLDENEKLYLFFSSSLPDETIHSYLSAIETLSEPGITLVMRGFVPGERHSYLIRITKKDKNCTDQRQQEKTQFCERYQIMIKIQPTLFDKYEITQIPALVYERQDEAWKITGNSRLDYLMERINREANSPELKSLITTLQRGRYE